MEVAGRSPLEKIEALTARLIELEADRERAVASAMGRGATWAEIGEALGVSAQAAHKRYRWLRHSPLTGECWYEPPLAGARRARG
jgi:ECF sigma factor